VPYADSEKRADRSSGDPPCPSTACRIRYRPSTPSFSTRCAPSACPLPTRAPS